MQENSDIAEGRGFHARRLRRTFNRIWPGFVVVLALFSNTQLHALTPASDGTPLALANHQEQTRALVVGSEQDFPPLATGMTDETAGGFTVELWKAVAAEAGLNYSIRVRPFHQLLQEFRDRKIDVLINLAQSDERRQFADFSVPHVTVHGAIFVRNGESRIHSEDDLAGKSIVVLNADLAHDYAVSRGWKDQLVLVDTAADGLRLLASGRHDAMLLSRLTGLQTLQALAISNVQALKTRAGFAQKFTFATHKGQADLLARLNEGLAITKANGVYSSLYEKWFGVYEVKEVGLGDLLKYIIPLVALFLMWVGYLLYRRQLERNLAHAAIAESRDLLMTIINTAPVRVFWKDRDLRYLGCNSAFARDAGLTQPDELIGKDDFQMTWAAQAERYRADDRAVMASDRSKLFYDEPQTTPTGQTIWLRTSKVPLKNQQHEIIGLLGMYEDITERKLAEDKLRQLSTAVEQNPASVVVTNLEANIQYVNPRFTEVTGYSAAEVIGRNPRILQSHLTPKAVHVDLWRKLTSGQVWHGELINRRKNGEIYWEDSQIAPVKDSAGSVTHYVAVKTDITARKQLEEEVHQMAFHDALTKLPNRRLLIDRLTRTMTASKRSGRHGALMFLDLDNFKPLNDAHGHDAGDLLLLEVATRLTSCVRETDTVSRFGGDEFVVLLSDLNADRAESVRQAGSIAEKIRLRLAEPYRLTIQHGEQANSTIEHRCNASIGIVVFISHEVSQDDILKAADAAMYRAKDTGRNKIDFHDPAT